MFNFMFSNAIAGAGVSRHGGALPFCPSLPSLSGPHVPSPHVSNPALYGGQSTMITGPGGLSGPHTITNGQPNMTSAVHYQQAAQPNQPLLQNRQCYTMTPGPGSPGPGGPAGPHSQSTGQPNLVSAVQLQQAYQTPSQDRLYGTAGPHTQSNGQSNLHSAVHQLEQTNLIPTIGFPSESDSTV